MSGVSVKNPNSSSRKALASALNCQSHSFAIQYASLMLLLVTFLVGNMVPMTSKKKVEMGTNARIGKEELPLNLAAGEQVSMEYLSGIVEALKNHDLRANFEIGCKFETFGSCFKASHVMSHFLYRNGLSESDFSIRIIPEREQATVHFESLSSTAPSQGNLY